MPNPIDPSAARPPGRRDPDKATPAESATKSERASEGARPWAASEKGRVTTVGPAASLVSLISPDVEASLEKVTEYVKDPARFTAQSAAQDLRVIYSLLLSVTPEQVDMKKLAEPGHARGALDKTLALQQELIERCRDFGADYSLELADEMRNVDRALHHLGDGILLMVPGAANDGKASKLAKDIPGLHWQADPRFSSLDKLPDTFFVLVDLGTEVSNTIRTIMSVNAMGSHVAMVRRERDPATGKVSYWVGEALAETGFTVKPLDEKTWFQKSVRAMLFVPGDPSLQRAFDSVAPKWLKAAKAAQDAGNAIPYNFTLDPDSKDALFCSQMLRQLMALPEFKAAAGGTAPTFPRFLSKFQFSAGVSDILSEWGIAQTRPIAPGDIAVDPSFRLVATGRTLPTATSKIDIQKGRMMAVIYNVIFSDWFPNRGYRLRFSPIYHAATLALVGLRHIPLLGEVLFGGMVPKKVPSGVLGTVVAIRATTQAIYVELEAANAAFRATKGRDMMFVELKTALEKIRLDDLERYRRYENLEAWTGSNAERSPRFTSSFILPKP